MPNSCELVSVGPEGWKRGGANCASLKFHIYLPPPYLPPSCTSIPPFRPRSSAPRLRKPFFLFEGGLGFTANIHMWERNRFFPFGESRAPPLCSFAWPSSSLCAAGNEEGERIRPLSLTSRDGKEKNFPATLHFPHTERAVGASIN